MTYDIVHPCVDIDVRDLPRGFYTQYLCDEKPARTDEVTPGFKDDLAVNLLEYRNKFLREIIYIQRFACLVSPRKNVTS